MFVSEDSPNIVTRALAGDAEAIRAIVDVLAPEVEARVARALDRRGPSAGGKERAHELEDTTREVFVALFADSGKALQPWEPTSGVLLADFVAPLVEAKLASQPATDARSSAATDDALADYEPRLDDMARARIVARLVAPPVVAPPTAMFQVAVRATRARRAVAVLVPVAIAIAALLFLLRSQRSGPVPEYALALSSGETAFITPTTAPSSMLGASAVPTLDAQPDARIAIVARPAGPLDGTVAGAAFFYIEGGAATAWRVPIVIAPDGTARIEGIARDILPGAKNDYDVVLAVGRTHALPTEATLALQLQSPRADVKLLRCHIVLSGAR